MLWTTFLCLVIATLCFFKVSMFVFETVRSIRVLQTLPSPPGAHWFLGHQKQDPLGPGFKWLLDTVEVFPRIYTTRLGPMFVPTLVHPETIRPLLTSSTGSVKSKIYSLFADWLGEGLAISNGIKWKRHRRLLNGSFYFDVLRTYFPVYNDCVEVLLQKMDRLAAERKPMNVEHQLGLCTFDIILRTACSHQSNCQLKDQSAEGEMNLLTANSTLARIVQSRTTGNPLLLIPLVFRFSSLYPEWQRANRYIQAVTNGLIKQRRKDLNKMVESGHPLTSRDFLDTILLARDADGSGLTDQEIIDEVNTFLFGGHDTTSSTLTWVLYALAKYPEHQSKVREEVDAVLGNRDSERITSKDLNSLEYTSLVIKEVIRMYTPVLLPSRTLTAPYDVDGVTLPIGTTVVINLYQLHHNPTVWGRDHMDFKPSRFQSDKFSKMDPFSFLPFSAGPRNCIGQQFAQNQVKVVVARVLRRFCLSLVEGEPEPVPCVNVVVKPLHDLRLNIEPRNFND
ncbi:cytochrome P450 4F1-like [Patiria miniata]|uniref:Cytochrome P450 n=1 Tax=Patiria miniata TaxID=46514 RepID=A0A913YY97_PATMI|nr:cytochrome P450 4F1-like [Patiria miniata]